jgi:hypothetical protein
LLVLDLVNFFNNELVTVHHVLGFLVTLRVLDIVEVDGLGTIGVAIEQAVEVEPVLTVLDYVVLLFLFYFLNQARADEFPPFGCTLGELVLARGELLALARTDFRGFGKKWLDLGYQ